MNAKTAAPKGKKKTVKPLRRAKKWGAQVPNMAAKLLMVTVVAVVLGLIFSIVQSIEWKTVRLILASALVGGILALHYIEGLSKGIENAASSHFYDKALAAGKPLTDREDSLCYQPMKALCAALTVYGIPLVLALYLCVTAKPYTYQLQDLPLWLTNTYGSRADVMAPLAAYTQPIVSTVVDWIRTFVRLIVFSFVSFFDEPVTMSPLIDQLSPLFVALMPLAYMIGYLRGPVHDAKVQKQNKRAKKVAARKAQRSTLVSELLGEREDVHYGHRQDSDKHKKKELI